MRREGGREGGREGWRGEREKKGKGENERREEERIVGINLQYLQYFRC